MLRGVLWLGGPCEEISSSDSASGMARRQQRSQPQETSPVRTMSRPRANLSYHYLLHMALLFSFFMSLACVLCVYSGGRMLGVLLNDSLSHSDGAYVCARETKQKQHNRVQNMSHQRCHSGGYIAHPLHGTQFWLPQKRTGCASVSCSTI